ncbi:hypothetical protein DFS34DRAFT_190711 [Phlyctochytrium arcticum]|nr:hypothetical protein DFS34DRAFT_190711 [Phlyctochytrium arcticum]
MSCPAALEAASIHLLIHPHRQMASKARPSVTAKSSKGRVSTTLASGHPALPPQLLEIYSQTISSLRPRPPSQPHHRHGSAASSHRPRVVIAQKEPEALQEDLLVAKSTINALNQDKKMLTVKIRTLEHEIDNLDRRHEELLTINMLVGKGRKVAGVEDKVGVRILLLSMSGKLTSAPPCRSYRVFGPPHGIMSARQNG